MKRPKGNWSWWIFPEYRCVMNRRNYQKELDEITDEIAASGKKLSLCLHVCCAPCSSYCMEYLCRYFDITLLFYNPNMDSREEYEKRKNELLRLIDEAHFPVKAEVLSVLDCFTHTGSFALNAAAAGARQVTAVDASAYSLETAKRNAALNGFDFFTTTLSISPLKNAEKINEIGERLGKRHDIRHLPSDFKKRDGYKRSIELSREYGLYRQDYCGCVFSKRLRNEQRRKDEKDS